MREAAQPSLQAPFLAQMHPTLDQSVSGCLQSRSLKI